MKKTTAPPSVPVEEQPYPVPENWRWVRLSGVIHTTGEKTEDFSDGTTVYIGLEHMEKNAGIVSAGTVDEVKSLKNVFHRGQILYGKLRPYLNKHDIAPFDGVCSTDILVFDTYPSAETQYVHFYLDDCDFLEYVVSHSKGIHLPRVSEGIVLNKAIPLPPLPEQRRIVERLESLLAKLDGARDRAQAVLDGYEYRRAAILHKAFTGELTAKWRAEHGVSLDSWKTVRLSEVCTVNPPRAAVKNLPDTLPVSFVPMSAVSAETGTVTERQTRPLEEVRNGFPNFSEGDVLFAKITPCMENGKSALVGNLVNGIGYGSTEFYVIRCGEELSNRLLFHLVRGAKFRIEAKAVMTGSVGQMRTPRKFIEQYEIPLPSKAEQEQMVLHLDTLFDKEQQTKAFAEAVLTRVDLMKKAILGRAFRGLLGTNRPEEGNPIS